MVRRDVLLSIALATLAALVAAALLAINASAEGGSNLTLGPVTYTVLDTDADGWDDAVSVIAPIINRDLDRSEVYSVLVSLWFATLRVDAMSTSELLAPNTTVYVDITVGTTDASQPGDHTVEVELHSGDLTGELVGRGTSTHALRPLGAYALEVVAAVTSAETLESGSAQFNVTVSSDSNNPTGVVLSVSPTLGWMSELSTARLDLDPGQSADVVATVHVPHNAAPGSMERVLLLFTAERNVTATGSVLLSVMVPIQLYELSLEVADPYGQIQAGASLEFVGLVQNAGNNADAVSMEAMAPVGWEVAFEPASVPLDRGTGAPVLITVTAPTDLAGSGTAEVVITARSQGLTTFASRTITLSYASADLSVSAPNITVSPSPPVVGEPATVEADVLNHGLGGATDVVVALLVDGTEVDRATVPAINAGETVRAMLRWTAALGYHRLRVQVDPDGAIAEEEEDDNAAEVGVTVAGADLVVTSADLTMEPGYPAEGDVAVLTVRVRNLRTLATGPFDATLAIDGAVVRTFHVEPGVEGVSNVTLVHNWTVVAGRHSFKMALDTGGAIFEQDEANNEATRQFTGNARPVPALSLGTTQSKVGETVQMVGSDSSDPDGRVRQWFYDYGDGTNSGWTFFANGSHSYQGKGEYTVRLYVRDETGAESAQPALGTVKVTDKDDVQEPTPGAGAVVAVAALLAGTAAAAAASLAVASKRRRRGR